MAISEDGTSAPALVTLTYQDLKDGCVDLRDIESAFGDRGLGILTVSGVPQLAALRSDLLPQAAELAALPPLALLALEDASSHYNIGWSHGKEDLEGGAPDTLKGSFYANPLHERPTSDPELTRRYPAYYGANVWPSEHLPGLRTALRALGTAVVDVGALVLSACDAHVASVQPGAGSLLRVVRESRCSKARLLHYFPPPEGDSSGHPWCAWHTDHGALTGLVPGMFLRGGERIPCPDERCGLYVRSRGDGAEVKVSIPEGHLAFQIGEAAQVLSGGALVATPHCVRGPTPGCGTGVSRSSFAVFMQPNPTEPIELPRGSVASSVAEVRQWVPGLDFGAFSERKFAAYYA